MPMPHRFERDVRVVRAYGFPRWLMSPRSASETCPEHAHKGPVGARREEFEGGSSPLPGDIAGERQQRAGQEEVRPRVERPLAGPGELPGLRERGQVRNRPLIAIWPSGAHQIREQVQMEAGERERRARPAPVGETDRGHGDHGCNAQIVAEHVMVRAPPQERMWRMAGQELGDKAKPIDVGKDTGERDQRAIAPCERDRLSEGPPEQGVGEQMHRQSSYLTVRVRRTWSSAPINPKRSSGHEQTSKGPPEQGVGEQMHRQSSYLTVRVRRTWSSAPINPKRSSGHEQTSRWAARRGAAP